METYKPCSADTVPYAAPSSDCEEASHTPGGWRGNEWNNSPQRKTGKMTEGTPKIVNEILVQW